jgi:hypothetical protein
MANGVMILIVRLFGGKKMVRAVVCEAVTDVIVFARFSRHWWQLNHTLRFAAISRSSLPFLCSLWKEHHRHYHW